MQQLRYPIAVVYVFLLALPVYIFLSSRWASLGGLDPKSLAFLMFPLFGLIAFSLVSLQVIIGPNIKWLKRIFPGIYTFHRFQGIFAFLFALVHPLLLVASVGIIKSIWTREVVAEELRIFILFGEAALLTMLVTVPTAFAAWKLNKFSRSWRVLHFLNYLVFIFAWIHSWFIGSDVRTTPLKYVWLLYLAAGLSSLLVRAISPGVVGRAKALEQPAE